MKAAGRFFCGFLLPLRRCRALTQRVLRALLFAGVSVGNSRTTAVGYLTPTKCPRPLKLNIAAAHIRTDREQH